MRIKDIRNSEISKCNKDAIITSYNVWIARGISEERIAKIFRYLYNFCRVFEGDIRNPDKEQLLEAITEYKLRGYSDNTICDTLKILKEFLRNCGTQKAIKIIPLIKTPKIHTKVKTSDLITDDEWVRLNNAARPLYFRAFLEILRWSGFRLSEALSVKKGGLWSSEAIIEGKPIIINYARCEKSKTVARYVPFIELAPALFNLAQVVADTEDFIFPQQDVKIYYDLLVEAVRNAKIKKRIWFHLFRHTRYTEWRNKGVDPMTLKRYMGWSQGSNAWMEYEHMTESQYDYLFLKNQV